MIKNFTGENMNTTIRLIFLITSICIVPALIHLGTSNSQQSSETTVSNTVAEETTVSCAGEEETAAPTSEAPSSKVKISDVDLLARIIYLEAGGCTYRHKQLVGCVVINRMNHPSFPNTLTGVIYQKNQYYPEGSRHIKNANPDSECYEIAEALLTNGNNGICPANVLFQAEFIQGEIYEVSVSPYGSTTYFCYG